MRYKNPNPLTKEKLKQGVEFGNWLFTQNKILGHYIVVPENSIKDVITGQRMPVDKIDDDFLYIFDVFCGAVINGSLSLNSLCIIQEAPESEVES